MSGLPEIPDEAVTAAAMSVPLNLTDHLARTALTAAWPRLYAAALRHAADETGRHFGPPAFSAQGFLRRLADEATS